jgi:uracil-DNA glycosylase
MMSAEATPESWRGALEPALATPEARKLSGWLRAEEDAGREVYPPRGTRLAALAMTPLDHVRCVILGQDPYHGPGQANGLAFSVAQGVRLLLNSLKLALEVCWCRCPKHLAITRQQTRPLW